VAGTKVGTCIDDEMHALRRIGVSMDTAVWYEMARSIALDLTQGKKKDMGSVGRSGYGSASDIAGTRMVVVTLKWNVSGLVCLWG
jgi:hypothetical protein